MTDNRKFLVSFDDGGNSLITMVAEGEVVLIDPSHVNYTQIVQALQNQEDPSPFLQVGNVLAIDDRVEVEGGTLRFDGVEIHELFTNTIVRYHREGRDTTGLVSFMDRLSQNPSENSRQQLFSWVQAKDLTIDSEGYIVAFKSVNPDMTSVHSGTATVDGVEITGNIPNHLGAVVEMERQAVVDNPDQGCSFGLHIGTHDYASTFGPADRVILEVRIDPADVVSVPRDSGWAKMRCCRYEVIAVHERKDDNLSHHEPPSAWDDDRIFETLGTDVPRSFLARFRDRWIRRTKDDA